MTNETTQSPKKSKTQKFKSESCEILKYLPYFLEKNKLKEPFYNPPGCNYFVYGLVINKLTVMINKEGVPLIFSYHPESRELGKEIREVFEIFGIQAVLQKFQPKKL